MDPTLKRTPRLFIEAPLASGQEVALDKAQGHYLGNVMRLKAGDEVRVFNGHDGEWLCGISEVGKRGGTLQAKTLIRPQIVVPDLHYLFAPLKHARLDYMVQKATELGASLLQPVITDFTNVSRIKQERMRANAIEAAEQCNLLAVPKTCAPEKLSVLLNNWPSERTLIFCDETAELASPLEALQSVSEGPLAVLIGPEGGFSASERKQLLSKSFVTAISLGPRTMRADTAATAALALVQAVWGDWH